jgi:hypothetical protein
MQQCNYNTSRAWLGWAWKQFLCTRHGWVGRGSNFYASGSDKNFKENFLWAELNIGRAEFSMGLGLG